MTEEQLKAIRDAAVTAMSGGDIPTVYRWEILTKHNAMSNPTTVIALLDEIESLRKDAARYRWLRKNQESFQFEPDFEIPGWVDAILVSDGDGKATVHTGSDFDDAIDAAMEGEK